MQRSLLLLTLALLSTMGHAFTGSDTCRVCHAKEHQSWLGSHHQLAMQLPTAKNVLGDFNNAQFEYNGVTTKFFRRGGKFMVRTDGPNGQLQDFTVSYVFGVSPLQQYLLPLGDGRLQALSIAWDARPASQGGQRWYHLYADEAIDHTDPLHWTGPYHNWNSRCAECHSTDVQKNFIPESRSYNTQFAEISVGCEACHGPAEQHLELVANDKLGGAKHAGFPVALDQRGLWKIANGATIAQRASPVAGEAQITICARCHARRGTLGDYHHGADFLDTHRPSLLHEPLYYPDGQIRDEVYVWGSFLQSKMHRAGVVCSNCHEPHSLALRAPGNGVCAQCHSSVTYESQSHHRHPLESTGAQCANCHMPETTYMGVDPRRDHSMRIPRPDLSAVIDTPNACNQCHTDKDTLWAAQALRKWGVTPLDTGTHVARSMQRYKAGDLSAVPRLAQFAADSRMPNIQRATILDALGPGINEEVLRVAATQLESDKALLRLAAVRAVASLPPQQRWQLLSPYIQDPIAAVRLEIAQVLAPVPLAALEKDKAQVLAALFEEYESTLRHHSDMPATHMQLGIYYMAKGDAQRAENAYREALRINAQLIPAYLNLADLMRAQDNDAGARKELLQALAIDAQHGPTLHALGLLESRSGNSEKALNYLRLASEAETAGTRHRFVYAIALHDTGQARQAIAQLQALLRHVPQNADVLLALANYSEELGEIESALKYARSLTEVAPQHPGYRQVLQRLQKKARP